MGVVPVMVATAFAIATPAAQAASSAHYFSGGLINVARIAGGEKVSTIAWGTLSLTNLTTGANVTCHVVSGGGVENPEPGGEAGPAGTGETQSLGAYGCESEACMATTFPGYISIFPEGSEAPFPETGTGTMTAPNASTEEPLVASGSNLKWKSKLIEEGTKVRQESEKVKLNVICHAETGRNEKKEPDYGIQVGEVLKGSIKPRSVTHCCTPLAAPGLEFEAKSGTLANEKGQKTKIEGSLKVLGFAGEEVINAKEG